MTDPLKKYHVTDVVCGNRGGGVYHKGMDLTKGGGDGTIYAVFDGKIIATTNNTKNCAPGGSLMCSPVICPEVAILLIHIRHRFVKPTINKQPFIYFSSMNIFYRIRLVISPCHFRPMMNPVFKRKIRHPPGIYPPMMYYLLQRLFILVNL
jgi:hypothetical protein